MTYYKQAAELDINKQYMEAIWMYEESIKEKEKIPDAYINLAFIYWASANELNWSIYVPIEKGIRSNGYDMALSKLDEVKCFFDSSEVYFWELYFKRRTIYDDISESEILHILNNHPFTNLTPYFYLFLLNQEKYFEKTRILYNICSNNPILKHVYIKSLLDSNVLEIKLKDYPPIV